LDFFGGLSWISGISRRIILDLFERIILNMFENYSGFLRFLAGVFPAACSVTRGFQGSIWSDFAVFSCQSVARKPIKSFKSVIMGNKNSARNEKLSRRPLSSPLTTVTTYHIIKVTNAPLASLTPLSTGITGTNEHGHHWHHCTGHHHGTVATVTTLWQ
jgi:hypothetical protein